MSGPEQRIHARIHVSTEIDVATPSSGVVQAELRDLSAGGARFMGPTDAAQVGDTVELFLPSLDGNDIVVMAEVIRVFAAENQRAAYAVRFDVVEPMMRTALLDLMEVLLSTSSGEHRPPTRVARRIELRFGFLEELGAYLEEIAAGSLAMTVSEPLALYEAVDVTVPDLDGAELLILHARVVHQRAHTVHGGPTIYRVGLEFRDMRPEAKRLLVELLRIVDDALNNT
jgi:hypothetical protein